MNAICRAGIIILGGLLFSCERTSMRDSAVAVLMQNDQLVVAWRHHVRLAGGMPLIENQNLPPVPPVKSGNSYSYQTFEGQITIEAEPGAHGNTVSLFLTLEARVPARGDQFIGLCFQEIPEFKHGVAFWRYQPWISWTKPMRVHHPRELRDQDVQFFYWQYHDGTYGAAMPLCGHGYRTTLGQESGNFGSKSKSFFNGMRPGRIPQLTIGFGADPYQLFEDLYQEGLAVMGKAENLRRKKTFPEVFEYIGWCTWNSSDMGRKLNAQHVLDGVASFHDHQFALGWVLIDDGWQSQTNGRLSALAPEGSKFPAGFKPLVTTLKSKYGIREVGVWHTLNSHWNGIDPASDLGQRYRSELFSWYGRSGPGLEGTAREKHYFISPQSEALAGFFAMWHQYLRAQGVSFVKVDNQSAVERMCERNFPIWDLAEALHRAVNHSVKEHFNGAIINCMDMTADAYFNFGETAVARSVEDYFPEVPDRTYDLEKGNAAAHVLQAVYNALYFGQMVYPDFDMFQSHHPHAIFHALARALNCGPIYLTDLPGRQVFEVLRPLVYSDGRIIRADDPLVPTEDCLFQLQDPLPFKAFSRAGETGLLGVWNCADADRVSGYLSPADVHGLKGEHFAVYEHFTQKLEFLRRREVRPLQLERLGYRLYYIAPLEQGFAPLGLVNKYNAPQTIRELSHRSDHISLTVYEGGRFAAASQRIPDSVKVDGREVIYHFVDGMLTVDIPLKPLQERRIEIRY